jgi:stage II sporulation protein D
MNAMRDARGIRAWTPAIGTEPMVRVGVILDQDARDAVNLRLPGQRYTIGSGGAGGPAEQVVSFYLEPRTTLEVRHAADALAVRIGDGPARTVRTVRLSCDAGAGSSPTSAAAASLTGADAPVVVAGAVVDAPAAPDLRPGRIIAPGAGVLVRDVAAGRGFHWQKQVDQTLPGTIELLPGRRGVVLVNELPLEDYLAGVITAEMSGACPVEFLKAQCVVARSWLLALTEPKHDADPFDRCNDDCCQRYQGTGNLSATALEAVRATRGRVLMAPTGNVLDANYGKSCGGISETPRAVWGVDKPGLSPIVDAPADAAERRFLPITENNLDEYLDGAWLGRTRIYCSPNVVPMDTIARYLGRVDEADDYFRWTVRYERRELEQLLAEKLPQAPDLPALRDLRVLSRGVSGRANAIEVEWQEADGRIVRARLEGEYRIRAALHRKFLYSSAFAVRIARDPDGRPRTVTLRGAGWGHGVGLCQIGALGMALSGVDFQAICRHYYPQARLASVYG